MAKRWILGAQKSQAPQTAAKIPPISAVSSADAKKFGFENFGNTCYANSVLQALYFCAPFRELTIQTADNTRPDVPPFTTAAVPTAPLVPIRRKPERKQSTSGTPPDGPNNPVPPTTPATTSAPATLFAALRALFVYISTNPSEKGTIAPRAFIDKLKEINELFRSTMHQDAHEFLNYLLNRIVEEIEEDRKNSQNGTGGDDLSSSIATLSSKAPPTIVTATASSNSGTSPQDATLVHKLFEGVLTSETRCLTCETVSSRDESFLDLSIDIEQNSSVTACLRQFSASEMLCQKNKFFCDSCCDLQEAEKRMKIKKLPNVLALHLKRFKYQEDVQKYIKLAYRVAFPFQLRLFNTVDDMDNADRLYNLFAIVVHIGNGPHHGHYVSIIKTLGTWLVFDDDNVYPIPESDISKYYGDSNSGSAYVLYYQAVDIDLVALGLRQPPQVSSTVADSIAGTLPPRTSSPSLQGHPTLPPGLVEHDDGPSSSKESQLASIPAVSPINPPIPIPNQKSTNVDLPESSPQTHIPPITPPLSDPARNLRAIFANPLKRAPSTSATRPTTGNSQDGGNVADIQKREKVKKPSASTPSLLHNDPDNIVTPPPLPPLPQSVHNSVPTPQSNGKDDRKLGAQLEKSKTWFRKRKSFRLGEKSSIDENQANSAIPPSPSVAGSSSKPDLLRVTGGPRDRPARQSSGNGGFVDAMMNGYQRSISASRPKSSSQVLESQLEADESITPESASSSISQHSGTNIPQLSYNQYTSPPGVMGPSMESPPARKHFMSQQPPELPNPPPEVENIRPLPPQYVFSGGTPLTPLRNTDRESAPSHIRHMSNGAHESAAYSSHAHHGLKKGKTRSIEENINRLAETHNPRPTSSRTMTLPPTSMAVSIGANNSTNSTSSTTSSTKRPTRKLSLTAPMLGFSKR